MEEIELEPSEELAYWIGAIQADGSLKLYKDKRLPYWKGTRISMHTSFKSREMIEKIKILSKSLFRRRGIIWTDKKDGSLFFHISVGKLLKTFKELDIQFGDPPKPPKWCSADVKIFGAYLAGVIDGDGSIRKTGGKVRIKITSGSEQTELKKTIKELLDCWVGIYSYKRDIGSYCELEFDVRVKTLKFFRDCLIPKLVIERKRQRLSQFIDEKYGPNRGVEPRFSGPQPLALPLS